MTLSIFDVRPSLHVVADRVRADAQLVSDSFHVVHARWGAGTFVVGVVEFGEIANMNERALSSGR
jgi:hypothetical protein